MDPLISILRNSSLLVSAQVVASLIAMALMVLVSRVLGDVEFGRLHLALSLTMIFGVVVEFGLSQVVARAVAQERARAGPYLRKAAGLVMVLGALFYGGLVGAAHLLGYTAEVRWLALILGVLMVTEATSQLLGALFQAHEQMLVPALARVAGNAFTLAVVVPLLLRGQGAATVATVMVLAAAFRVALQAVAVRRLYGFELPGPPAPAWRGLLAAGLPFLAAQGLGMFVFRVDVVMLGRMASEATVGWYGAACRLMEAFNFIPQFLTMATFPVAARLWAARSGEFRPTVRKTLHLLLVVAVPVAVVLLVLAEEIVGFLFTLDAYGPSVPVLRVHALSLAMVFVDYYLVGILMAMGRERVWIAIVGAACVVNPALNVLLIPPTEFWFGNGGIGAAVATLVTEVFILAWALYAIPAGTFGRASARVAARAAVLGGAMAAVLVTGRALGAPWMLAAAFAGVGYLIAVVRLGILPQDVSRWARGMVRRRPAIELIRLAEPNGTARVRPAPVPETVKAA
ncbi:MAG TPA: flippase [Methylomirabilota bacterium]|nr:flippase [Methylomirabilota bacterium]